MSDTVPRSLVDAFYAAYAARDADRVVSFLDEDVEWTISGPVDVLPFCGSRRGREAVRQLIVREVPAVFDIFSFVTDTVLIDGGPESNEIRIWMTPDGRTYVIESI